MRTRNNCAIGVMAKAPQAGRSKTRLCPPLTPEQAAALSAGFLHDITANVAAASRQRPMTGYIAYAPAGSETLFDGHIDSGTEFLLANGETVTEPGVDGFGRCLLHAIRACWPWAMIPRWY